MGRRRSIFEEEKVWRNFTLEKLFEVVPVKKVKGKASDFPKEPDAVHTIPLLTASTQNRGLSCYAAEADCPTIMENVIGVSANGTGIAFYHDSKMAVLQDAYALILKRNLSEEEREKLNEPLAHVYGNIPHKAAGLFLAACLNKLLFGTFDWSNKSGWNNIKEYSILLPVNGKDEPDWEYMKGKVAECVVELKKIALLNLSAIWRPLEI